MKEVFVERDSPGLERSQVTQPGLPSPRPLVWLAPLLSGVSPLPAWLVLPPRAYGSPPAAASVAAPRPAAGTHIHDERRAGSECHSY